ncbi:hypothetical protein QE152_g7258 [Popillia japonica]|uniref:CCHC-type domain-containing protein n=1 Tax=Popillia japonica TaxID=7064 RepID=A0AAW1MBL5_POPJA
MISALAAPKMPKENSYNELIKLLEKHLAAEKNILLAQHQFLSKHQTDKQRTRTKRTIVSNINTSHREAVPAQKINYRKLGIDGLCLRCGKDNHTVKDCRSDKSRLKCTECKKSGNVAKEERINSVQKEAAFKDYRAFQIIDIYQNRPSDKDRERYAQVNVEEKSIQFEIDSGSGYTVLPRNQYAKLKSIQFEIDSGSGYTVLPRNQYAKLQFTGLLEPATIRFRSYTRDVFVPQYVFDRTHETFSFQTEKSRSMRNSTSSRQGTGFAGIITKTDTSEWGSPLVIIPKADGGVRLCVDYKVGINERRMDACYPIRKIDEILDSLHNSRFFCRLDLYKAYLQFQVDDQSSEIQPISTQRGTYKTNRLSFGIKTAP